MKHAKSDLERQNSDLERLEETRPFGGIAAYQGLTLKSVTSPTPAIGLDRSAGRFGGPPPARFNGTKPMLRRARLLAQGFAIV
jgi:hypothetical protein